MTNGKCNFIRVIKRHIKFVDDFRMNQADKIFDRRIESLIIYNDLSET